MADSPSGDADHADGSDGKLLSRSLPAAVRTDSEEIPPASSTPSRRGSPVDGGSIPLGGRFVLAQSAISWVLPRHARLIGEAVKRASGRIKSLTMPDSEPRGH
ncbi:MULTISPECIES: hypothetical protein [Ensifer]|nr:MULTISPECIES: hypothetical protein [Ensifer]KQU88135.1 hypothetical protein ASD00_29470 [Ensifer sp. Root31]UBI80090.1 hypothetical protein J3R84_31335 [Ensifer canadensis]